ncbi:LuxR family transcriptional regulator [Streptomyces sp. WAC06273]|uniref:helix-turn-helix transcriptional regulator n=1 Tax=Streptomyces sp. WAC06273 TaxID=2487422 RepID=UPI000F739D23|nr:LuxR family transcriptional regulator [Streptomyces sp. WAC06273]RSS67951.1 LuxR family transcriptional regulator [Streptomyces sp. WAC06273]
MLVERARTISELSELIRCVHSGRGGVAVITGPAAVGKTELTHSLAEIAEEDDLEVLRARMCVPGGQGRRGLFEQLAESLRRQPGRSAGTFAGEKPENPDGAYALAGGTVAENPLRAAEEIARYAHRQPLLVVIDDLHHADPDSLDGILHLVRACRTARIMMVLVASDCSYEQMPLFHAELLRAPHYRRVRLRPLSRLAVAEVVADSLGSEVAERSAADYYRYSGGNPLALRALIQEWSSTRFTDEAGPETARGGTLAPGKVSALAVFTSLHRSGPQAMAVARGMALLGPAAGLDLLCQLLRSTPEDVTRHLQDLEAAGVLDGFRFRHPGVAQVLLTDPDFHDLRELHLAAAALLDADGHSALRVARHLIAADIVAEPWTVAVLRESAREAAGHNDWDFALKCLRLALRGALTDEERGLVVSEFLRVGWRQNPARVTKHFQECFELQQKGHVPDAETLTLLTIFLWHGHVEDAVTMLLDVADRCADGPLRTEIQTFLDWARLSHPGLLDRIRRADEQLLNRLLETSSDSLRPLTSLSLALCETGHTNVPATAQEVLADRRLTGDTAGSVLQSLLYAGELVTAERWAARAVQDAEQLATPLARGVHQAVCAEIARRRGDLPAAQQLAERALTHMAPRAWGVALGLPLSVLVAVHTARGHTERAGEHLSWSVHPEMYQTLYGLHYLQARGRHHLAVGQYAAALRDFRSCEDRVRAWGLAPPVLAPWRLGQAEAALALGDRSEARRLTESELNQARGRHPHVRAAHLRVYARLVDRSRRREVLTDAAELVAGGRDRYEHFLILTDLSRAHQEADDTARARVTGQQAWHSAVRCGAERLARTLLPESAVTAGEETPVMPRQRLNTAMLSEAELRVAELAAAGETNREISGKLFITVSTVEQHLTRVYRKLRLSGRADLRACLATKAGVGAGVPEHCAPGA